MEKKKMLDEWQGRQNTQQQHIWGMVVICVFFPTSVFPLWVVMRFVMLIHAITKVSSEPGVSLQVLIPSG